MPRDLVDLWNPGLWLGDASSAQVALWQAENHWAALCPPPVAFPIGCVAPVKPDEQPSRPDPL